MSFRSLTIIFFITLFFGVSDFVFARQKVELLNSFLTSGGRQGSDDAFKRTDESVFLHEDKVFYLANLIWEDVEKSAGKHKLDTKWYSGSRLVSSYKNKSILRSSPWNSWSWIYASTLGYGDHKVELYLGGELIDTRNFRVLTEEDFFDVNHNRFGDLIKFLNHSQASPKTESSSDSKGKN